MFNLIILIVVFGLLFATYWYYFNGGCSNGGLHKWKKITPEYKEQYKDEYWLESSTKICKKCGLWR